MFVFATAGKIITIWATAGVFTAVEHGILSGYEDGTMRPRENATRAEAVTIIVRALEKVNE